MKVRCNDEEFGFITKGRVYEVVEELDYAYIVLDDDCDEGRYAKSSFDIIKEEINMKEVTLMEVLGTIKEGEEYKSVDNWFMVKSVGMEQGNFKFVNGDDIESNHGLYVSPDQKFTRVAKPISFMEALENGRIIRIEHPLMDRMLSNDNIETSESIIKDDYATLKKGGYVCANRIIVIMGWKLSASEIADLIQDGKCYVREGK